MFLKHFCRSFKLDNFILIGHSFGGRIAVYYSYEYANVRKLVLYSASGVINNENISKRLLYYFLPLLTSFFPNRVYRYQSCLLKPNKYKNYLIISKNRSKMMAAIYSNTHKLDLSTYASRIKCPTLLIYGENDLIVPLKAGMKYESLIKKAHLVVIPEGGHFTHIKNKSSFFNPLMNFLSSKN